MKHDSWKKKSYLTLLYIQTKFDNGCSFSWTRKIIHQKSASTKKFCGFRNPPKGKQAPTLFCHRWSTISHQGRFPPSMRKPLICWACVMVIAYGRYVRSTVKFLHELQHLKFFFEKCGSIEPSTIIMKIMVYVIIMKMYWHQWKEITRIKNVKK